MAIQKHTVRFDELVWPHMASVLRTAEFLSHNVAEAEDLAQDTMVKAFRSIDALRDDTCVKAWLMTILRRAHLDRVRSVGIPEQSLEAMNLDPMAPDEAGQVNGEVAWEEPEEVLEAFSDQQIIVALKELPKEIRWTLLLVDVEGLEQSEAAEVLEIPVGTVKSRVHRGRAMLHTALLPPRQPVEVGVAVWTS